MAIFSFLLYTFFFAIAVWLIPGLLGGVIITFALRRENIPLEVQDIINFGGQWMFAFFLGGLLTFGLLILISIVLPEGYTAIPPLLIDYLCFGAGAAVVGARGARIILNVLNYS
jgi:hypothetical protein